MKELAKKARRFLMRRRHVYTLTFRSIPGEEVLADLSRFCHANKTTAHPNRDLSLILQGRREVWLRIANHLHMTPDELYRVFEEGENPNVPE